MKPLDGLKIFPNIDCGNFSEGGRQQSALPSSILILATISTRFNTIAVDPPPNKDRMKTGQRALPPYK